VVPPTHQQLDNRWIAAALHLRPISCNVRGMYRAPCSDRYSLAVEVNRMRRHQVYEFDNRDSAEVYGYLEARIEAMKRRIAELEIENARLVCELQDSRELMSVCA